MSYPASMIVFPVILKESTAIFLIWALQRGGYVRRLSSCLRATNGLHVIDEALRLPATHFDRFWVAESHRLRGELLLLQAGNNPLGKDQGQQLQATMRYMLRRQRMPYSSIG